MDNKKQEAYQEIKDIIDKLIEDIKQTPTIDPNEVYKKGSLMALNVILIEVMRLAYDDAIKIDTV